MSVRVKICGITRPEDALVAVEAGADALGFVFWEASPRCLSVELARAIIATLPPWVAKTGVFVNASQETVRRALDDCGLDTLQFHGDESPEFCARFKPVKVVRAFRVRDRSSLGALPNFAVDAWLLDSFVPGQPGGTGARFNWVLAVAAKSLGRPVILAGGLTPDNVADAVRHVKPFGVDVSSGVEAGPGLKDAAKVRDFIQAAKMALKP